MEIKSILGEKVLIEWRKMQSLQPDNLKLPYNIAYLKQSLIENNFAMPFFGWQNGEDVYVVDGHQRLQVLMELEGEGIKIPELLDCQLIKAKDRKEAVKILLKVYNQRSNPIDLEVLTEWINIEQVEVEVQSLNVVDINDIEEEAQEVLEAEEDDFDAPEGGIETDIVLGDLYEIGEHRLLCGDSTDSDAVARLMDGSKADMVFTDPPYGVSYQSNMRTKSDKFEVLQNDNVFITEWINNLPLFSKGFVFVWTSWKVLKQWIEFCEPIGELSNLIVWDKGGGGIGDLKKTFLTDFEVALCYNRGAEIKGKRLGSVWNVGKDSSSKYLHPTQKPVELSAMAIENVSIKNDLVLDLFLGSGSTMVASHQLKRKCYGMELDPKYCDVIIKRMIKLDSNLKVKRNGIDETKKWLDKIK